MSLYWTGKLGFDLRRSPELSDGFRADPESVLDRYHFTNEEKDAVRNKDIKFFYEQGVNPFLIGRLAQFLGLDQSQVRAAIADAKPHPASPTVVFPGPPREGKLLVRDADVLERALGRLRRKRRKRQWPK
jgi:hypothetical protein